MNNSNKNHLNIFDLPDEILFIILKKLNMVDVVYSLVDVNQRFDRLAVDSLYVRNLNMTNIMTIHSRYDQTSAIPGVPKVREKSYRIYFLIGSRYSNNFFYRIVVLYLKFLFNIIHFITNAQNDYHRLKYINSFFPRY